MCHDAQMSGHTESGTPFSSIYGPDDLAGFDADQRLGTPGQFPYTRGVYSSMYTERPWTMRQYAGFGTAAESNARYLELIAHGTTGLVGGVRSAHADGDGLRCHAGLR